MNVTMNVTPNVTTNVTTNVTVAEAPPALHHKQQDGDHGVVLGQVVQLPYRRSVRNWSKVLRAADGRHIHGVADVTYLHRVYIVWSRPFRRKRFAAADSSPSV